MSAGATHVRSPLPVPAWAVADYTHDLVDVRPSGVVRARSPDDLRSIIRAQPNKPGKCPSCGSHEFKERGSGYVCSYCRSAQ